MTAPERIAIEDQRLAGENWLRHLMSCETCEPRALCGIGHTFSQGFDRAIVKAQAVIQRGGVAA